MRNLEGTEIRSGSAQLERYEPITDDKFIITVGNLTTEAIHKGFEEDGEWRVIRIASINITWG